VGVLDDELAEVVLVQRNDVNERNRYNKMLEKHLEEMRRKLVMQEEDDARRYEGEANALVLERQAVVDRLN
jgi:hypothetical protein